MKFCIVHYNTPELTACLCGSIIKQHDIPEIIIFDNSDKRPFKEMAELFGCVYFDNTKGQLINFKSHFSRYKNFKATNRYGSAMHAISIQWLLDHIEDEAIFLDSDVLIKKPLSFTVDNLVCVSDVLSVSASMKRISPMLMYVNILSLKQNKISFYDPNRILGNGQNEYDTGASFLQDLKRKKLPFKTINQNDYIVHYGNGSWRKPGMLPVADGSRTGVYENISAKEWLMKHLSLWQ